MRSSRVSPMWRDAGIRIEVMRVDLEGHDAERLEASAGCTIGMSFVVLMVGHAMLMPALAPRYGSPSRTRRRSGSSSLSILQRLQEAEGVAAADEDRLRGGQRRRPAALAASSSTSIPSRREAGARLGRVGGAVVQGEGNEEEALGSAQRGRGSRAMAWSR